MGRATPSTGRPRPGQSSGSGSGSPDHQYHPLLGGPDAWLGGCWHITRRVGTGSRAAARNRPVGYRREGQVSCHSSHVLAPVANIGMAQLATILTTIARPSAGSAARAAMDVVLWMNRSALPLVCARYFLVGRCFAPMVSRACLKSG